MTVLTKASDMGRKPDINNAPLVDSEQYDPERVCPHHRARTHHLMDQPKDCTTYVLCFWLVVLSIVLLATMVGMAYKKFHDPLRYKGYCTIPIEVPRDIMMQDAFLQKQMEAIRTPLRWTDDPDVTVYTTVDEASTGDALNSLLERFEIDDNVEKISIFNSGNNVEFIHDFNVNATGIVDQKRCFTMELDPATVLSPGVFVLSIQRGAAFDVRRVRTRLRAVLPPASAPAAAPAPSGPPAPAAPDAPRLLDALDTLGALGAVFAERCADKPTYKLEKGDNIIRRKRSPDEPSHEYMHFAGRHLQEITIDNLDELLEYEKKLAA